MKSKKPYHPLQPKHWGSKPTVNVSFNCESTQIYHLYVIVISAPISSTTIRNIKHVLTDCHTFQIVAKSGQFIHYLQRCRIDFSHCSSAEGSIDISIFSIDITNACTEVVVAYERNTFQLHTRSIQLSQIIGTTIQLYIFHLHTQSYSDQGHPTWRCFGSGRYH